MTITTVAILMIAAHVLADFYLQPYRWIEQRTQRHFSAPGLYWHGAIHAGLALIALWISTDVAMIKLMAYAVFLGVTHIAIDGVKSYSRSVIPAFVLDQIAHLAVILFVVLLVSQTSMASLTSDILSKVLHYKTLAVITGYLLVLRPVSIVIKLILAPWSQAIDQVHSDDDAQPTLEAAGQNIGYLERVLILTFILLNQFAAIGFLLAAKSVFRFGDLRQSEDKKLTEYVMLGTLTSFAITIVVGLLVSSVATQLPLGK